MWLGIIDFIINYNRLINYKLISCHIYIYIYISPKFIFSIYLWTLNFYAINYFAILNIKNYLAKFEAQDTWWDLEIIFLPLANASWSGSLLIEWQVEEFVWQNNGISEIDSTQILIIIGCGK
jgi:hypothetical protein